MPGGLKQTGLSRTRSGSVGHGKKNNSPVVSISAREASLRRKVRRQLRSLGFSKSDNGALEIDGNDKDVIRSLHGPHRTDRLSTNSGFLSHRAPKLLHYFASGRDINPAAIQPELERVYAKTWQADLFRLAALTWSVPVSNGFGRRLRYVIWDAHNEKLLGLIAIGDPVFNLSVRDSLIGWDAGDRRERLVNVMDAYVLGALPPYNMLLGGKMVACLVRSRQIYNEFTRTYGNTAGIISGKAKKPRLLAVTTCSSMGRSSVYNRLKLGGVRYFQPIGYTRGWGHFHISDDLFLELRDYLRGIGHRYADQHRFGAGPQLAPSNHPRRSQGTGVQRGPAPARRPARGLLLQHGLQRRENPAYGQRSTGPLIPALRAGSRRSRARTVDTPARSPTSRLPLVEQV